MSNASAVIIGTWVAGLGVTMLLSGPALRYFNSRGLSSGGVGLRRGESQAELHRRNLDRDRQTRQTLSRFRPWAIAAIVVGLAVLVVGFAT